MSHPIMLMLKFAVIKSTFSMYQTSISLITHSTTLHMHLRRATEKLLHILFFTAFKIDVNIPGEPNKNPPPTTFVDITAMHGNFCTKFYTIVKRSNIHFITKFY